MYIGLLTCSVRIYGAYSLKEKRRVLQSVMSRIRQKWNLSVAEVAHQDQHQLAELAIVGVSSSKKVLEQELRQVEALLNNRTELELFQSSITFV